MPKMRGLRLAAHDTNERINQADRVFLPHTNSNVPADVEIPNACQISESRPGNSFDVKYSHFHFPFKVAPDYLMLIV